MIFFLEIILHQIQIFYTIGTSKTNRENFAYNELFHNQLFVIIIFRFNHLIIVGVFSTIMK